MTAILNELTVEHFRSFSRTTTVPLDADVVLIYGTNGAGKTNLLTAIELALTGTVRDLKSPSDYPRCLRNAFTGKAAEVTLGYFRDGKRDEAIAQISTADELSFSAGRFGLIPRFRERCYLSQRQLVGFCEAFAAPNDSGAAPIIAALQELLGLELVSNLENGLHDIEDLRRARNHSQPLALLEDRYTEMERRLLSIRARADRARETLDAATRTLQDELIAVGIEPHELQTRDGLRAAASMVNGALVLTQSPFVAAGGSRIVDDVPAVRSAVQQNKQDLERREAAIRRAVELAARTLAARGPGQIPPSMAPLAETVQVLRQRLDLEIAKAQGALQAAQQLRETIEGLTREVAQIQSDLETLQRRQRQSSTSHELVDALAAISRHVKTDLCPVCGRDYAELKSGDLRARLDKIVGALREDAQQQADVANAVAVKMAEREERQRLIDALHRQRHERTPSTAASIEALPKLQVAIRALDDIEPDLQAAAELEVQARQLNARLTDAEEDPRPRGLNELREIAGSLSTPTAARSKAARSDRRREQLELARTHLRESESCLKELESIEVEERDAIAESKDIASARVRAHAVIERARQVLRTARSAELEVISQVFEQRVNDFVGNLFRRLVPEEPFRPSIIEPSLRRRRIQTGIEARADGVESFDSLASVLNSGHQNVAAVVLFLAFNLVDASPLPVLVLDDPVQSMDDLHVAQLTAALRQIVDQNRRQMVIAVHERALFDYLRLELGPSRPGQTLLTIELERGLDPQWERRTHVVDRVRFG